MQEYSFMRAEIFCFDEWKENDVDENSYLKFDIIDKWNKYVSHQEGK